VNLAAMPAARFPPEVAAALEKAKILGVRAGDGAHAFTAVWPVVVEGRLFIRSWSRKPRSWLTAFEADPRGTIQAAGREIAVRAVRTRSERLKAAVDAGYRAKYPTPASRHYVDDFCAEPCRSTTTELVPLD
jgi:hypothetical protein